MKIIQTIKQHYILVIILLVGVFLRFYRLDFQSPWLDETLTLRETEPELSFKAAYDLILFRDSTSFLYNFIVKYLSLIIGHSIFTARLVSAIAGVLSILYIFRLGKVMLNERVGYFAAILLSVNLFHIEYSQEARSYSLLVLFVVLVFYRLYLLINKTTLLNAIYLGIFAGLATNAHPIGLLNVAAIYIILFFVILSLKGWKLKFNLIKYAAVSGIVTLMIFYLIYPIVLNASKITSFWIPEPSYERMKQVFTDIAGKSELLLLLSIIALVYVSVLAVRSVLKDKKPLLQNKLVFGYMVLFVWIFFEIAVVLVKSYTDVSILLNRYLIAILPAIVLMMAISIELLKKSSLKYIMLLFLVCFSFYNIFYVTHYHTTVAKAQFDIIADFINRRNDNNDKVVSRFGFLMGFYINKGNPKTIVVENTMDNFVGTMKSNSAPTASFWYYDGNSAEFTLSTENQKFLDENFTLKEDKKMFDSWAKHYEAKVQQQEQMKFTNGEMKLFFKDFKPQHTDDGGNILMFENSTLKSPEMALPKGTYVLVIKGNSLPNTPIKGENAHLKIKVNGNQVGECYLSEKTAMATKEVQFRNESEKTIISIEYDNDVSVDKLDRNVILYNLSLKTN